MQAVQFVSLGPGSVDTVTLGALKALQHAEKIYCFESNGVSRAAEIIRLLDIEMSKVVTIDAPMSKERSKVNKVYDNVAETIVSDMQQGINVAVATEGDTGIFATTHYVMDRLTAMGIACMQISGIPSFIAAGGVACLHLVKQTERLMIIPGRTTSEEIEHLVDEGCNLVIMKLSMAYEAVAATLRRRDDFDFWYFENIGLPTQRHLLLTSENIGESFPYFSLMVIQKKAKN